MTFPAAPSTVDKAGDCPGAHRWINGAQPDRGFIHILFNSRRAVADNMLSSTGWEPGMGSLTPARRSAALHRGTNAYRAPSLRGRRGSGTTVPKDRLALGKLTAQGLQALKHEEEAFLSGVKAKPKRARRKV